MQVYIVRQVVLEIILFEHLKRDLSIKVFHEQVKTSPMICDLLLLSNLSIAVFALSEWLDELDVCRLDTALCNLKLRNYLLISLAKSKLINKCEQQLKYEWMALRGIGVKTFKLFGKLSKAHEIVLLNSSVLLHLHVFSKIELSRVLQLCPCVLSITLELTCEYHMDWSEIFLGSLEELVIHNELSIFRGLNNINPHLKSLIAPHVTIADNWYSRFKFLDTLEIQYSAYTLDHILECSQLKSLSLLSNEIIVDTDLLKMAEVCPMMERFSISALSVPTNTTVCSMVSRWSSLIDLKLGPTEITDEGLHTIVSSCPLLECLACSSPFIGDKGVKVLTTRCKYLTSISIYKCRVTDVGAQHILVNAALMHIALQNARVTDNGLKNAFEVCPTLTSLQIIPNKGITGKAVLSLLAECTHLSLDPTRADFAIQSVNRNMEWKPGWYLKVFSTGLKQIQSLTQLRVTSVPFPDDLVASLAKSCPLLSHVDFIMCKEITGGSIRHLARSECPLVHLNWDVQNHVGVDTVQELLQAKPTLTTLMIRVTDPEVILVVLVHGVGLKRLSVNWQRDVLCPTQYALELIQCSHLKRFNIGRVEDPQPLHQAIDDTRRKKWYAYVTEYSTSVSWRTH